MVTSVTMLRIDFCEQDSHLNSSTYFYSHEDQKDLGLGQTLWVPTKESAKLVQVDGLATGALVLNAGGQTLQERLEKIR